MQALPLLPAIWIKPDAAIHWATLLASRFLSSFLQSFFQKKLHKSHKDF